MVLKCDLYDAVLKFDLMSVCCFGPMTIEKLSFFFFFGMSFSLKKV